MASKYRRSGVGRWTVWSALPAWISAGVALAALSCGSPPAPEPVASAPVQVTVAAAARVPFAIEYRASGTVRGRSTAVITSKISGYIKAVHVRSGDAVTAGAPIVELEAADTQAAVARARAALARAIQSQAATTAGLDAAQVAARSAEITHRRVLELRQRDILSQQEFEDSEARLRGAQASERAASAQLAVAASSIEEAQAALAQTQAALADAKITAPFSGLVIERRIDPGNLAAPGTPLLVLQEAAALRVEASVEESRAAALRVGQGAVVELDGHAPAPAVIVEMVPSVDVGTRTFIVKLELPPSLADAQPGSFARVRFALPPPRPRTG